MRARPTPRNVSGGTRRAGDRLAARAVTHLKFLGVIAAEMASDGEGLGLCMTSYADWFEADNAFVVLVV